MPGRSSAPLAGRREPTRHGVDAATGGDHCRAIGRSPPAPTSSARPDVPRRGGRAAATPRRPSRPTRRRSDTPARGARAGMTARRRGRAGAERIRGGVAERRPAAPGAARTVPAARAGAAGCHEPVRRCDGCVRRRVRRPSPVDVRRSRRCSSVRRRCLDRRLVGRGSSVRRPMNSIVHGLSLPAGAASCRCGLVPWRYARPHRHHARAPASSRSSPTSSRPATSRRRSTISSAASAPARRTSCCSARPAPASRPRPPG